MTDWEKLKVTDLKDELKARGIPLTGLKLKQQLIDKLVEVESESQVVSDQGKAHDQEDEEVKIDSQPSRRPESISDDNVALSPATDRLEPFAKDSPVAAESKTQERETDMLPTDGIGQDEEVVRDTIFIPEQKDRIPEEDLVEPVEEPLPAPVDENVDETEEPITMQDITPIPSHKDTATSTRVPTPDFLEDQRKRKRRSATPVPESQEVAYKKARTNSGEAAVTRRESKLLEDIQAATDEVQDGRAGNSPNEEPIQPMEASDDPEKTAVAKEIGGLPDALELQTGTSIEANPTPKQGVTPAIHPVTSSLYMRNFKRPLHIATLRTHISNLAESTGSSQDPIKIFYLDNIRTHAFVSFTSPSAATQVRNAMHESRFPDEQMRDPLWIDFIPDEKVQTWIDRETGNSSGFGGGRGGGKYEVVYDHGRDGIEASLRDVSGTQARPTFQQRPSRSSQDQIAGLTASALPPERVPFVPREKDHPIRQQASDVGKGFKALDELFPSTTTKPKLYYKPVPQAVVSDRLNMLRELKVGHSEMGRSGDEGMKRYTLETYKNKEEWVDKGPEFGFGRKGQDRLEGVRGRGGLRGGFRGARRGADSWRGR